MPDGRRPLKRRGGRKVSGSNDMLHFILLILKIIGLILAAVLGLLLTAVLLVLLVPVRYRAQVRKKDSVFVKADVGWLFRLFHVRLVYDENLLVQARLLGFLIFSTDEEWKKKKDSKNAAKRKKREEKEAEKAGKAAGKDDGASQKEKQAEITKADSKQAEPEKAENSDVTAQQETARDAQSESEEKKAENGRDGQVTQISRGIISKIKALFAFVKTLSGKIKAIGRGILDGLKKGREGIKELIRKLGCIKNFLTDTSHKSAFGHAFGLGKRMLFHVLPVKIRGSMTVGTGDPCSTGQLLGVLSLLYAKTGGSFTVTPDFEQARFEGEILIKGRIRAGTLLILIIRIIADRGVRKLITDARKFPELLKKAAETE